MLPPTAYQRGRLPRLSWNTHLEVGFALRCFQRLSFPNIATQHAPGGTIGTLGIRPTRSSRTRVSSSQYSHAHNR
jgi:hypothetical protein